MPAATFSDRLLESGRKLSNLLLLVLVLVLENQCKSEDEDEDEPNARVSGQTLFGKPAPAGSLQFAEFS